MRAFLYIILVLSWGKSAAQVEIKTWYDTEKKVIKEIYTVDDSLSETLNGPYRLFYSNGTLNSTGSYQNGLPTGHWVYYYENGNLKMQGELRDNTNYGQWEFYYENGNKSREGELYNGLREGTWTFYYENGQIKSQGKYDKSISEGIWNYYYEDGQLKGQAYYEGGNGTYKEFYGSGVLKVEGENRRGKSNGLWKFFYESGGIQSEGLFAEGVRTGEWRFYHENGELAGSGNYVNGKKSGEWRYYYPDGTLSSEGFEKNNQKDGFWKLYYDTGELKGEGNYTEGNGDYKEYYPNGRLKITGQILNSRNEGQWLYYYEDGSLEGEVKFREGKGLYTGYYPDGRKKTEGLIDNDRKTGEWKLYDETGKLAGIYRPIYEEVPPVYKTTQSIEEESDRIRYEKPDYTFRKRSNRYFTPVINEYRGGIIAFNPLFTPIGLFPFSLEYYAQERMGYELMYTWMRKPFFKSKSAMDPNDNFRRGFGLKFRQKFYQNEGRFGMLYFGHEISYTDIRHEVNYVPESDPMVASSRVSADERRFEYGVTVGNRWVRDSGNGGITLDAYVGVGIGVRNFEKNYPVNEEIDQIFNDVHQTKTSVPFIFGLNFGFIVPKRATSGR